jgi:hypothetical protein
MIDVLEHIPNPEKALKELRRISQWSIFKVPLEDNLWTNVLNLIKNGGRKIYSPSKFGHVNFYTYNVLKNQIEDHNGKVVFSNFTNAFECFLNNHFYSDKLRLRGRALNHVGVFLHSLSPRICAKLLPDFSMLLVKSYNNEKTD